MTLDKGTGDALMGAGASAVRFNCPMGRARVADLIDFVGRHGDRVIDLGCGRGGLAIELAAHGAELTCVGVDTDTDAIEWARAEAAQRGVSDRVEFKIGDVTDLTTGADVAICIGSAYAFGDTATAMRSLRRLGHAAVVGDLVWAAAPGSEHREIFGDLPEGEAGLADLAVAAGWTVAQQSRSSLEEWDEFELTWIGGVRAVATPEATAFADERLADYRSYRGVAGFGWTYLTGS